jgi:protein SCO1/2
MKLPALLLTLLLMAVTAAPAAAHELTPDQLASVRFDQQLGQRLPLDLLFRDETGATVRLGDYFANQGPVILTLNYFHCQNLCPLELDGLINGLNGVSFTLGQDYTLLTVNQQAIDRLTDAVGFQYVYDQQQDDFAHPAGVVVLTPAGQISRYLYGLDFSATDLRLALVDAGRQRIGSLLDRALLVCYHYDPLTGRYTPFALNFVRGGAAAGAVGLAIFLGWLWRAEFRRRWTGWTG